MIQCNRTLTDLVRIQPKTKANITNTFRLLEGTWISIKTATSSSPASSLFPKNIDNFVSIDVFIALVYQPIFILTIYIVKLQVF